MFWKEIQFRVFVKSFSFFYLLLFHVVTVCSFDNDDDINSDYLRKFYLASEDDTKLTTFQSTSPTIVQSSNNNGKTKTLSLDEINEVKSALRDIFQGRNGMYYLDTNIVTNPAVVTTFPRDTKKDEHATDSSEHSYEQTSLDSARRFVKHVRADGDLTQSGIRDRNEKSGNFRPTHIPGYRLPTLSVPVVHAKVRKSLYRWLLWLPICYYGYVMSLICQLVASSGHIKLYPLSKSSSKSALSRKVKTITIQHISQVKRSRVETSKRKIRHNVKTKSYKRKLHKAVLRKKINRPTPTPTHKRRETKISTIPTLPNDYYYNLLRRADENNDTAGLKNDTNLNASNNTNENITETVTVTELFTTTEITTTELDYGTTDNRTFEFEVPTTTTTTTQAPKLDIPALLDIIANLTYDYEANLTYYVNRTLQKYKIPTCPTPTTPSTTPWTTTLGYDYWSNGTGTVMGKCFVCGLEETGIPYHGYCGDAFDSDFIPLTPVEASARGQVSKFRKYCRYLDIVGTHMNESDPKSLWGRWTGGCGVRWMDLSTIYTQRTCRNRNRAMLGKHFLSKRMMKLEMALQHVEEGCVISPVASLVPMSRGINLYARFHACVCIKSWCNSVATFSPPIATILIIASYHMLS